MAVVEIESAGAIRTVRLNRPEKRNALNREMLSLLSQAFAMAPPASERVTVIRAAGPVFCAGLDLATHDDIDTDPIEGTLRAIETYPLPVVAVVQGDAIAGGNELALHCDLVVAGANARFGMSLSQIGLSPSWFLIKKLLEVAGPVITRKILLLGDPMPAETFFEYGIISHIAEQEELEIVAQRVIDRLAANAPLSLKAMKAVIVREMEFRDAIAHDDVDVLVLKANRSSDAKEGMAARLAKRAARFEGR
ncbi:MAG TPA: enoyl-CoA hydratase/isomerase family protein [Alphaproteobacteria bacterium]|nr:enoyl-CoA hydratase/isomerase family protein [Alphaproteobacteria bacterium]